MELAGLGAVAFIDEDKQVTFGGKVTGKLGLKILDELSGAIAVVAPEFMDKGANQPRFGLIEGVNEIDSAGGAVNIFFDTEKNFFDL
jgi:hypothetical protein